MIEGRIAIPNLPDLTSDQANEITQVGKQVSAETSADREMTETSSVLLQALHTVVRAPSLRKGVV
jgi:hypothetical protein